MQAIKILKQLEKYPIFNNKKIREILHCNRNYAKLYLHRLAKKELIFKIERDKYTLAQDALIIASHLVWPAYFSCWTAFRYYNLTEQLPTTLFVLSPRTRKRQEISFKYNKILFIRIPVSFMFGYRREIYQGFEIFIATPEKALLDSLYFKQISVPEIKDILSEHKEEFNFELCTKYILQLKKKSLAKRAGYLLEKMGYDAYAKLKPLLDGRYLLLSSGGKAAGPKIKKWRIIENVRN